MIVFSIVNIVRFSNAECASAEVDRSVGTPRRHGRSTYCSILDLMLQERDLPLAVRVRLWGRTCIGTMCCRVGGWMGGKKKSRMRVLLQHFRQRLLFPYEA